MDDNLSVEFGVFGIKVKTSLQKNQRILSESYRAITLLQDGSVAKGQEMWNIAIIIFDRTTN
jgi:hypothetical protein